jgi:hypothetical protein
MMIELLLAQSAATAVLAFFIIMLRRELYPMLATAGPVDAGFWIRSIDVLVLGAPQFEASKTVIRIRWAFTEELFLKYSLAVYDVAMRPGSRLFFYARWKAWQGGDRRYDCEVQKPRGFSRLPTLFPPRRPAPSRRALLRICHSRGGPLSRLPPPS